MKKRRALIMGEALGLMCSMPSLLHRSGFDVDIITTHKAFQKSKLISDYDIVSDCNLIPAKVVEKNPDNYDFIIPCDDKILGLIISSDISLENKLKIIPVQSFEDFQHIYSKIGLSKVLSQAKINTPSFLVSKDHNEALDAAKKLGYPVMIKVNASGAGSGIFECGCESDIYALKPEVFLMPVLVQKKINGIELDLSALYRDSQLVNFCYSEVRGVISKFGPSSTREYWQLGAVDENVFLEMQNLGRAIGANGFINITAIKSDEDGKIYFFEADMRPNAWVEFSRFIGDDLAVKIAKWFSDSAILQYPQPINKKYPEKMKMAHFLRLSRMDLLCNRYNVWKCISMDDRRLVLELLYQNTMAREVEKCKKLYKKIKRLPLRLVRLIVPEKTDRLRIRQLFNLRKLVRF
jgi:hypothetical protein